MDRIPWMIRLLLHVFNEMRLPDGTIVTLQDITEKGKRVMDTQAGNETRKVIATLNGTQVIHAAYIINRTPGYNWPAGTAGPEMLRRLLNTYAASPVIQHAVTVAKHPVTWIF